MCDFVFVFVFVFVDGLSCDVCGSADGITLAALSSV